MAKKKESIVGSELSGKMEGFSSGYGLIDMVSGVPGILFPRATIIELYGLKSASKTTLLLEVIAYNQMLDPKFKVLYADFEKMIRNQVPYLNSLGVEVTPERFTIIEPETQEEGCQQILDAIRAEEYDMIVVDTVAAMRPAVELEKGFAGNKQMGIRAKNMAELLRNAMADIPADGPAMVFINQEYKDIQNTSFVQTYNTPSSDALAFYAGIRLEVKELQKVKDKKVNPYTLEEAEIPYGSVIRIKALKNKVGMPFLESKYFITYGEGIDIIPSIIAAAKNAGIINKRGSNANIFTLSTGEEKTIVGESKLIRYFKENLDELVFVGSAINELWAKDMQHLKARLSRKSCSDMSLNLYETSDSEGEALSLDDKTGEGTLDMNNLPEGDEATEVSLEGVLNSSNHPVKKVQEETGLKLSL